MDEVIHVDEPIRRFPRLPKKDGSAAEEAENRVAELDEMIFRAKAQTREAKIVMGRAFNEEKELLGHGGWQKHFEETFASWISLRTAERYMKRARKVDSISKNDTLSNFESATDRGALEIREASRHAQTEVAAVSKRKNVQSNSRHIYRLPLRMTSNEHNVVDALQKLPDWPRAEKKIVRLLRSLGVEYKLVNEDYWTQP